MKMFVITDAQGKVIGSYRPQPVQDPNAPVFRPVPLHSKGQKVYEIDVPDRISTITSARELHDELAKLIGSQHK
jgi:hypothetical protein